jgi:hypothetical protein
VLSKCCPWSSNFEELKCSSKGLKGEREGEREKEREKQRGLSWDHKSITEVN